MGKPFPGRRYLDQLPGQLGAIAQAAIKRLLTHPGLTEQKRIDLLRKVSELSAAYLRIAEMMPHSLEFNAEEWSRFVDLCQALGFDPAGLRNRE